MSAHLAGVCRMGCGGGASGRGMVPPPGARQGVVVWRGGGPLRAGGRGVGSRVPCRGICPPCR